MYQVKVFGPTSKVELEEKINAYLRNAGNLKLLDTKTRIDGEDSFSMTLVMATPRPYDQREMVILECASGSENITKEIDHFKASTFGLKKVDDVVIVPADADHEYVYLKVFYTVWKGSNTFQNN